MKYRSILSLLLLCATSAAWSGCSKFLDQMPDNRVQVETDADIARLIVNAYPGATQAVIAEVSSDNIDDIGVDNAYYQDLALQLCYWNAPQNYDLSDGLLSVWGKHYGAISQANMALEYLKKLEMTPTRRAMRAEALITRAYAHFMLINLFAPHYNSTTSTTDLGLPYMEEVESELNPLYERGNVADFYAKLERDIEEALPDIDDAIYQQPKYHFNRAAAYAFAARFFLYYEKWDKAIACANEVLGATQPVPASAPFRNWNQFRQIAADADSQAKAYTAVSDPSNLMLITIASNAYNIFNNNTYWLRFSHSKRIATEETVMAPSVWGNGENSFKFRFIVYQTSVYYDRVAYAKYPNFASAATNTVSVPFTTEETLLVRAEAYAHLQQYDKSMADLNALTEQILLPANTRDSRVTFTLQEVKDFYDTLPYSSAERMTQKKALHPHFAIHSDDHEAILHYILHLRRIMTLHEGLRWYDIRRYGIEVLRLQHDVADKSIHRHVATLESGDPRNTIQIPADVLNRGFAPNPR